MDAHTRQDPVSALHRAYLDALRKAAQRRADRTEPTHESIVRAHRRAAALERLRAGITQIDLR